jgi:hypothetical protein
MIIMGVRIWIQPKTWIRIQQKSWIRILSSTVYTFLSAFLNNVLEMRLDAKKLLVLHR